MVIYVMFVLVMNFKNEACYGQKFFPWKFTHFGSYRQCLACMIGICMFSQNHNVLPSVRQFWAYMGCCLILWVCCHSGGDKFTIWFLNTWSGSSALVLYRIGGKDLNKRQNTWGFELVCDRVKFEQLGICYHHWEILNEIHQLFFVWKRFLLTKCQCSFFFHDKFVSG